MKVKRRWLLTAHAKAGILEEYRRLREKHSKRTAARLIGIPWETLYRWTRSLDEGGVKALEPRKSSGRPPNVKFTAEELAQMSTEDQELIRAKPGGRHAHWSRDFIDRLGKVPGKW